MAQQEDLKTYRGNCHCGAFVYEVKVPEIKVNTQCNCSICHKKGYAWVFPTGDLNVVKGSVDALTAYKFNTGGYTHRFCPACGTPLLADNPANAPGQHLGINARALQDLDVWSLKVETLNGKALPSAYEPPAYDGPEPSAEMEGGKIYNGSCHCGAVTLALKVNRPLEDWDISIHEERIIDCNCSICVRGAYIWVYPKRDQSVILGEEHLSYRVFNNKILRKTFCKHCGVFIANEPNPDLSEQEIEALEEFPRAVHERLKSYRNLTLRTLNDFDCTTLPTRKGDGKENFKPAYVNP